MREVGLIEVCAREIGSAQTRVPKQTAVNIRALEIRRQKDTSKIQLMEIDFRQVRMAKLETGQVYASNDCDSATIAAASFSSDQPSQ